MVVDAPQHLTLQWQIMQRCSHCYPGNYGKQGDADLAVDTAKLSATSAGRILVDYSDR